VKSDLIPDIGNIPVTAPRVTLFSGCYFEDDEIGRICSTVGNYGRKEPGGRTAENSFPN
jgi:hypothetical protein